MADETRTTFAKMGDEFIHQSLINMSGNRSPYTQAVSKKSSRNPQVDPSMGTKKNRGATQIQEAHGPQFRPVATLGGPSAVPGENFPGEPQKNLRNTKLVRTASGNRDFWANRQQAGATGEWGGGQIGKEPGPMPPGNAPKKGGQSIGPDTETSQTSTAGVGKNSSRYAAGR